MKKIFFLIIFSTALFLNQSCSNPRLPLEEIRKTLAGVPDYSVILDDMKEEGNFFKSYYHKYKIVTEDKTIDTGWKEVPKEYYDNYYPFLGMTLWVKKDGKETQSVGPPGYEHVGDSRYGQWRNDSSGNSFWEFYGKYRMFSDFLGGTIFRNNYDTYSSYRYNNQPYYGPRNEYGTEGTITKKKKPNFYERRMSSMNKVRSSFSDKVNQRIGRTKTGFRSRGISGGK